MEVFSPMRWMRRGLLGVLLCLLCLMAVYGCTPPQETIRVELTDFRITPERVEVKAGRRVRLEVVNWGHQPHDLLIAGVDGAATYRLQPLRYQVLEFEAPEEPGTYRASCTVTGHAEAGMTALFVVSP